MLVALRCFSERTQQSHTIALAKSRYGERSDVRLALDVHATKSLRRCRSVLPIVFSRSYSDRVITREKRNTKQHCSATAPAIASSAMDASEKHSGSSVDE